MSKTIVLVSCVKSKRSRPGPARDLYTSTLFKGTSAYAQQHGDRWFILSAKYGLLDPDQVIAPYEKTLNKMPVAERRAWAKTVINDLKAHIELGDEIIFLAGQRYRENLVEPLRHMGCKIEIPMEGMPFGMQLSWLKEQTNRLFPELQTAEHHHIKTKAKKTGGKMSLANQIREYTIKKYIEPARKAGNATAKVTAKEIHTDLGLKSLYPSVCNALDGDIFKEQAKVIIRSRSGPKQSSTVSWTFEVL